jgi:hypothetical protein
VCGFDSYTCPQPLSSGRPLPSSPEAIPPSTTEKMPSIAGVFEKLDGAGQSLPKINGTPPFTIFLLEERHVGAPCIRGCLPASSCPPFIYSLACSAPRRFSTDYRLRPLLTKKGSRRKLERRPVTNVRQHDDAHGKSRQRGPTPTLSSSRRNSLCLQLHLQVHRFAGAAGDGAHCRSKWQRCAGGQGCGWVGTLAMASLFLML